MYGTIHLLRAVNGTARVIVARTPGERDAMNVYAASKAAAWTFCQMYCRTQSWPVVGAMLYQAYGPGQPSKALIPSAIGAALRGEDFPMTHGRQQRDWVYIDDVVEALMKAASVWEATPVADETPVADDRRHQAMPLTLEIGMGRTVSVREVVGTVYRIVNGSGRPLAGIVPARPGEVERQVADADRTERLIGWRARVTLDAGLRETIEWGREWLIRPVH